MPESTPTPTPSRANYGFALYLASRTAFFVFLIWAIVPDSYLHAVGLTYLPQKYWALALPIHLCNTLALFAFVFYPALNLLLVPAPNDLRVITDSYAVKPQGEPKPTGIPFVSDIPISEVCKKLYLADETYETSTPRGTCLNLLAKRGQKRPKHTKVPADTR